MSDTRFWNATENAEGRFTGSGDVRTFRKHMKRLGHGEDLIRDRVAEIHPRLLDEFDALPRRKALP